jgi:hypothetical protein
MDVAVHYGRCGATSVLVVEYGRCGALWTLRCNVRTVLGRYLVARYGPLGNAIGVNAYNMLILVKPVHIAGGNKCQGFPIPLKFGCTVDSYTMFIFYYIYLGEYSFDRLVCNDPASQ